MTAIAVEAVIEEARRRAKHRRFALAVLAALIVAGGIAAGRTLTGGEGAAPGPVPAGFERVPARGPVTYLVLEARGGQTSLPGGIRTIGLTTGHEGAAAVTEQFWYDPAGGLARTRLKIDGAVRGDIAGKSCVGPLGCWPAPYVGDFDPAQLAFAPAGAGSFRGHHVRWFVKREGEESSARVAVDRQTGKVVEFREVFRGRVVSEIVVLRRARLRADEVSFVLPKSGAPRVLFSPFVPGGDGPVMAVTTVDYGFAAARRALGTTPLWLGPRYRGRSLRSVSTGVYSFPTRKGERLDPAPYVRFDYGRFDSARPVSVEVFGKQRPWFYQQGPRPGTIVREWGNYAAMTRDGLLIRFSAYPLTPAASVALAQSLRPLPASLKTLPTLRRQ